MPQPWIDATNSIKIAGNKLLANSDYQQKITENYIEVIMKKYDLPILQIFLNKKNNIEIKGVTSGGETTYVFGTKGYQAIPFPKPFLLMDESKRMQHYIRFWI
jgi:hypothetical protein